MQHYGSSTELATLWILTAIASSLSLVGSSALAHDLLRGGLQTQLDALLLVLALLSLPLSACLLLGRAFIPTEGEPSGAMCVAQANGIQFFGVATILWTAVMPFAELRSLQRGQQPLSAPPTAVGVCGPLIPVCLVSAIFTVAVHSMGGYGDATLWCWIASSRASWQLVFYYVPLLLSVMACLFSLGFLRREVGRRMSDVQAYGLPPVVGPAAAGDAVGATSRYLVVFVVCYAFGLINRACNTVLEHDLPPKRPFIFPLYVFHAFFLPLAGFGNALVHGDLLAKLIDAARAALGLPPLDTSAYPALLPGRRRAALSFHHSEVVPGRLLESGEVSSAAAAATAIRFPPPQPTALSIFAGTWNLGEAAPPSVEEIAAWLPGGRDVYAISLQECLHVSTFTRTALAALGGDGSYVPHSRSIGSNQTALGFHGHIVILVLVRAQLERSVWTMPPRPRHTHASPPPLASRFDESILLDDRRVRWLRCVWHPPRCIAARSCCPRGW